MNQWMDGGMDLLINGWRNRMSDDGWTDGWMDSAEKHTCMNR